MTPALLLIQAEKLGVDETTLRYFGAVVSGAIGGDGYVSAAMKEVGLTGGEREIALLWAAALAAYGIETEVRSPGRWFNVIAPGDDAARLARLYFFYGAPLLEGDERVINYKLAEAVELSAKEALNIRWEGLRQTKSGVAADLIISEAGAAVKYNVYLREKAIELKFQSKDRNRVELAARLLRLTGVTAKVKREGVEDGWYVRATTDMLAAGRKELRDALANIVREAVARGWIDAGKAERWLEKLESGRVLREGWPKYEVRLADGALVVKFSSTDRNSIVREAQRLREMGLIEGKHFTVKMLEKGGGKGYVYIRREGLAYAAWLSVHGEGEQRRLAAAFVELILRRAWEAGEEVYEKVREIIEEGKTRGSSKLEGFEREVEVNGRRHVVKVIGGGAEIEESRRGKKLLRLTITAEVGRVEGGHTIVDRVVREYTITYSRRRADNATVGRAVARGSAPEDRETDAERFSALVKALTGKEPRMYRMKNGAIIIMCGREHLDGFKRFAELADAIEKWLEETRR
jgi:Fe2+ transport system protein FeoA